jgi:hypothetical protein
VLATDLPLSDNVLTIVFQDTNKEWIEEIVKDDQLRTGELNSFQDAIFDNEMNALVHEAKKQYEETSYKLALKAAHYDFLNARDSYRYFHKYDVVELPRLGFLHVSAADFETGNLAMPLESLSTRTWSSSISDSRYVHLKKSNGDLQWARPASSRLKPTEAF